MEQLFIAVDFIHQHGLIHRNLQLENIMLTPPTKINDLRIIDLSMSEECRYYPKKCENETINIPNLQTVENIGYIAPEIWNLLLFPDNTDNNINETCDSWSLGCYYV